MTFARFGVKKQIMHDGPGLRVEHRSAVLFVVVVGLRVGEPWDQPRSPIANNEMLLFSRRVDSRGMDAALHFPITRQQCFKRVFILHGENSQRLAKVHAQFRERTMKDLPELLELVGDFPGFLLAGIADDGEIRGVHFDPSVFRSCGSVPTPNSQECK